MEFHDLLFMCEAPTAVTPIPPAVFTPIRISRRSRRQCGRAGPALHRSQQISDRDRLAMRRLLRARRSSRVYDDRQPITIAQLARLLDGAARIIAHRKLGGGDGEPPLDVAARPYPSAAPATKSNFISPCINATAAARLLPL